MPRPKKDGRYQKRSDAYWINSSLLYRASEVFYNEVVEDPEEERLLDKEFHYLEKGYKFMPYTFYKSCEDILEYKDYSWRGKHTKIFKLKEGCKIKVSAG